MPQFRSTSSSTSSSSPPPLPQKKKKSPPSPPRPSSSILLLSPTNEVLLLHRVQTSSSFPSAHVFPGGNCEAFHDGEVPADVDARHADGPAYRWAAVRECFEESGILLARREGEEGECRLARVEAGEMERARKEVHAGTRRFGDVLAEWGVTPDVDNLVPFTRWVTPTNVPKRFTTQMYLYLMPLAAAAAREGNNPSLPLDHDHDHEAVIPLPTPDGGVEHTAARFAPAHAWLDAARAGDIILFPPQFFLLHLVAQHMIKPSPPPPHPPFSSFCPSPSSSSSSSPSSSQQQEQQHSLLQSQRASLLSFVREGRWGEKCISPSVVGGGRRRSDGRLVLALDKPGPELEGSGREGVRDHVVLVDFRKEGPRRVEVGLRDEVLAEERRAVGEQGGRVWMQSWLAADRAFLDTSCISRFVRGCD
ncbi:putative nudix hydrolase 7 [Diplodia seriata]|uniref:Putative nudix hydrolase 7 n=1 Tax=Diplodia seriata TaxID=420778 RepID=A0A1S8BGE5_9PEZI|nr:putative nudix hydrolase 7 [Diplodia seriata]